MAEEASNSESVGLAEAVGGMADSVEATIESNVNGGTDSCTDNNNNVETSGLTSTNELGDREKSLEYAEELMEKGTKASKEREYAEAAECFSRALEIRAAHYGELALECVNSYYKYGCALLYKAQEESDPLGSVLKKGGQSQQDSAKDGAVKAATNDESSVASVSSNAVQECSSNQKGGASDNANEKDQEEDDEESDTEDLAEADEDESDLDLAWKMLDVARAIVEKHSGDTMEKVDILSALAEVALEREDIDTSLSDYLKALTILECLVEPDSRHLAELNFRICLCLELGSKAQEAIPYCQKAISICKSRVHHLMDDVKKSSGSTTTSAASELDQNAQLSSTSSLPVGSISDKEAEIETLSGLSVELEKKLEDLQQLVTNPTSILSDILAMVSAKAKGTEKSSASAVMSSSRMGTANSTGGFESPTVSTAHTNGGGAGVTHLGVVGRGVKRVLMSSSSGQGPVKKSPSDPSPDKGDSSAS